MNLLFVEIILDFWRLSCSRKKRKESIVLSSASPITTVTAVAAHRRCYPSSTPSSYSLLNCSAVDIFFRLTEGFFGQVEEVRKKSVGQVRREKFSFNENKSFSLGDYELTPFKSRKFINLRK